MKVAAWLISSLLFFSACGSDPFKNPEIREIHDLLDQRNTDALIGKIKNGNSDEIYHAALGFGSYDDPKAVPVLLELCSDKYSKDIRRVAAFSLGQIPGNEQLDIMKQAAEIETNRDVVIAWSMAIGKKGDADWLVRKFKAGSIEKEAFAKGMFYASLRKSFSDEAIPLLVSISADNGSGYYAASALQRYPSLPDTLRDQLISSLKSVKDINSKVALIRCLGKFGLAGIKIAGEYLNDENYLARVAAVRTAGSFPERDSVLPVILSALKDSSFHVRTAAAELLQSGNFSYSPELLSITAKEKYLKARYLLVESLLKCDGFKARDSLSAKLPARYKETDNEWEKAFILQASASDVKSLGFVEEETFSTPSILVRYYGFQGILNLRRSSRFDAASKQWASLHPGALPLDRYIERLVRNGLETGDVGLAAICAEIIRDTSLPGAGKKFPMPGVEKKLLEKALKKMRLPRDIETYNELFKSITFLEGRIIEGNVKPDYNSPINWDLAARIPSGQKIKIKLETSEVIAELWPEIAPGTVSRFVSLIKEGFYNGIAFHRVVPGFVVQHGCIRGDGYGSTMESLRTELSEKEFEEGILGMASAGPDTESCQWFITHTAAPHLNGRYTAFGKVVKGMETVHQIGVGDKVVAIELMD